MDINSILELNYRVNEKRQVVVFQDLLNEITRSFDNAISNELVEIKTDFTAIKGIIGLKSYLHSIFFNISTMRFETAVGEKKIGGRPVEPGRIVPDPHHAQEVNGKHRRDDKPAQRFGQVLAL